MDAIEGSVAITKPWYLVAFGTLLLCLGVSGVSLWIDEGYSAKLAAQPTLIAWANLLRSYPGSVQQTPGYYLYLWMWVRVFGASERALRMANLPFAALASASFAWCGSHVPQLRKTWLIFCVSPFMWFYMNEARPYAMVLCLSTVATIAILAYARDPQRFHLAPWAATVSLLALASAHMLAVTLIPCLLVLVYILRPISLKALLQHWIRPIAVTLPFYICLIWYYRHTLAPGEGVAVERPSLLNLIFALYEFLGFGGLGPPRNALRQAPSLTTLAPYLASLSLGVIALGMVLASILVHLHHSGERRVTSALSAAFASGLLIIYSLSFATHFWLLGRHLSALFPLVILLLLFGVPVNCNKCYRSFGASALLVLGLAWSVSSLRQRFLPRYQKDDYRDAAMLAKNGVEHGMAVVWIADRVTADYYGLQTNNSLEKEDISQSRAAVTSGVCSLPLLEQQLEKNRALLVVISDREVLDPGNRCREYLEAMKPELVANLNDFKVWRVVQSTKN
jgi:hypothetical protein